VYAVWYRNLWSDARFFWRSSTLDDRRVVNFWDSGKATGKWYAANVTHRTAVEWDAWFLYAPDKGFWEPPLAWGRTIIDTRESLRANVGNLLRASGAKAASMSK
jgi:hypothetical protein